MMPSMEKTPSVTTSIPADAPADPLGRNGTYMLAQAIEEVGEERAVTRRQLRRVEVPTLPDPGVDRAIDRVGQEVAVERRDRDAVDALRDEGLEDLFLPQLVGRLGRPPFDLDVAELSGRPFRADPRVVEDRDVQGLRYDREAKRLPGGAAG